MASPSAGRRITDRRLAPSGRRGIAKQPTRFPRIWTLELPRSKVLKRIDPDSTFTRVALIAGAPGTVRLLLLQRRSCDPPRLCPMAEPSGQSERMHRPLPAVAITIRVQ